ncbi:MAG: hypothetical protein ACFE8P_07880, partial [Promethearchaeota archaeon]
HITVLYSLIFYFVLRILGFFVSIDFYYSTKNKRFICFTLSWLLFALAGIFPIFAEISNMEILRDLLLLLNVIFASIASQLMLFGIFSYFLIIPIKIMSVFLVVIPIAPLILYVSVGISVATRIAILYLNVVYITSIVGPSIWHTSFKSKVGKSIRWYYALLAFFFLYFPISILILLQGYSYGLYDSNDDILIILNYAPPFIAMLTILIFLIHIEYNNNKILKNKLKDKYSHELGNILQVISGAADVIKLDGIVNQRDLEIYELMKKKCKDAGIIIKNIRKFI